MDKRQLRKIIEALTEANFNTLIYDLNVPNGVVPSTQLPRAIRVIELLKFADSPTGCTLQKVEQELREMGAISQDSTENSNSTSNSPRISQTHSGGGDNVGGNKIVNNDNRQISVGKNYIESVNGDYIEIQIINNSNSTTFPNTNTNQTTKTINYSKLSE